MATNYKAIAKEIIEIVGGAENIISAAHCATRLRLIVKDKELIDDKEGILKATLFVTENPDDDELKGMENMLKSKYNKEKVNISVVNDPELIGGFILKVGDIEYNKSFKYTFNKLKQKYDWR